MSAARVRCGWVGADPLYVAYHDREWAVPVPDDRVLFEFLVLEGAQAGLSWITILRKRETYRRAFARLIRSAWRPSGAATCGSSWPIPACRAAPGGAGDGRRAARHCSRHRPGPAA
jgi:hypothetical protein